jgi:hypothetical protein
LQAPIRTGRWDLAGGNFEPRGDWERCPGHGACLRHPPRPCRSAEEREDSRICFHGNNARTPHYGAADLRVLTLCSGILDSLVPLVAVRNKGRLRPAVQRVVVIPELIQFGGTGNEVNRRAQ